MSRPVKGVFNHEKRNTIMDDLIEEMEADFESNFASPLDNSSLATVSKLARAIAAKEKEITFDNALRGQ